MRITSTPFLLDAGVTPANQRLYNDGPGTVYYKSDSGVSSSSNDGSVVSGSSLAVTASQWLAAASGSPSNVRLVDLGPVSSSGGGGSFTVQDEGGAVATEVTVLNFEGAGVSAVDAGGGAVDVTVAAGGASAALGSPNTQTTDYTLVLGDDGLMVEVNAATGKALTVPPNSSVAFPVGALVRLRQMGVGQVTVTAGVGVTVRSRGTALKLSGQYAEATVIKRATDEWVVSGDVTP